MFARVTRALLALLLLVACHRDAATAPEVGGPRDAPLERADADGSQLDAAARQRRLRGLAAMDAGRFDLARADFAAVLEVAPDNLAVQALFDAATRALLGARDEAARSFAARVPTVLAPPPWQHTLRRALDIPAGSPPKLVELASAANGGLDEAAWFRAHGLRLPEYEVPNPMHGLPGDLPPHIPPSFGPHLLVQAIAHPDHTILVYGPSYSSGRFVAVLGADRRTLCFLDFAAYAFAPGNRADDPQPAEQGVLWAEARDGVLHVAHGHDGPAHLAHGNTAYLTALDLKTGELRWRSEPRVASAADFVIDGAHILTGYGYEAELDHVFVLARRTGEVVGKARVDGAPDYLLLRERRLFVRTRETDHEFDLR